MWPRIPRLELAALFPDGKTAYIPSGGKPITLKDYKLAKAKGLVGKTMVASATPAPRTESKSDSAATGIEMPQPILASFTPGTDPAGASGQPASPGHLFTYASVGGGSLPFANLFRSGGNKKAVSPTYRDAVVAEPPEVDDDHREQLSYVPFEVADLMTDNSLAYSRTLAPLVHPEQRNIDYMFENMDRPTGFTFRRNKAYQGLAAVQQFSGQAVKSLYAEMEAPAAPTRLAQSTR